MVVVNGDVDLTRADGFVLGVVELGHVRVLQGLLRGQSFVWVELQQAFQQVYSVVTGCGEHVSETFALGWGQ